MGGTPGWQQALVAARQAMVLRCKHCEETTGFLWPADLCFDCWNRYKYQLRNRKVHDA